MKNENISLLFQGSMQQEEGKEAAESTLFCLPFFHFTPEKLEVAFQGHDVFAIETQLL